MSGHGEGRPLLPEAFNDDYRSGYSDAVRFYGKHDSAREKRVADLLAALQAFVDAAESWHEFHRHDPAIHCDRLCESIPAGKKAIAAAKGAEAPRAAQAAKNGGKK